jgi:hypothetical protein
MLKKIILWFFAGLGVIFFGLLMALTIFVVTDPYNLRPVVMQLLGPKVDIVDGAREDISTAVESVNEAEVPVNTPIEATVSPGSVQVTDMQAEALESVGLSPSAISADQEACFVQVLGQARVDAIKAGDIPTVTEFMQAKDCLN